MNSDFTVEMATPSKPAKDATTDILERLSLLNRRVDVFHALILVSLNVIETLVEPEHKSDFTRGLCATLTSNIAIGKIPDTTQ